MTCLQVKSLFISISKVSISFKYYYIVSPNPYSILNIMFLTLGPTQHDIYPQNPLVYTKNGGGERG